MRRHGPLHWRDLCRLPELRLIAGDGIECGVEMYDR